MRITQGPVTISVVVPDAAKDAAEAWLSGIIPGGVAFVAQLATPMAPTVRVAWHMGIQVTAAQLETINAGADARGVGFFSLSRYEGIDTDNVNEMTLNILTNRTTHLGALGLVPLEEPV